MLPITIDMEVEELNLPLDLDISTVVIGTDPYEGSYVATPSLSEQIFPTNGKRMVDDFTVQAMPQGSATIPNTHISINPIITGPDSSGLINFSFNVTEVVAPDIQVGYIDNGTPGNINISADKDLQLSMYNGNVN